MTHIASSSDGAIGARTQAAHGEGVAEQLDVSDNHVSPPCGRRSRAAIQGKRKRLRAQQDAEAAAINALVDRSLPREKGRKHDLAKAAGQVAFCGGLFELIGKVRDVW